MQKPQTIAVLDFGSQYTQLIARRVREANVYCELLPWHVATERLEALNPAGIILSGGPSSVYEEEAPTLNPWVLKSGRPVLGICYGMQLLAHHLGGHVAPAQEREYGPADLEDVASEVPLFEGLSDPLRVWMSHGDRLEAIPPGWRTLARTSNAPYAAMGDHERQLYGIQFHPEVQHTPQGDAILANFLFKVCGCEKDWTPAHFIDEAIERIRQQVGDGQVICGLSGGVDSTVTATLIGQAIGDQLTCVFVDHGLLRLREAEQVIETCVHQQGLNVVAVNPIEEYLEALAGVIDPQQKRKIIGEKFVRIFEREARRLGQIDYLAQGTIYPDVIESAATGTGSAVIKAHHNVGGLPEDMQFQLVEPLRMLFKDEVRKVGQALGLPHHLVWRHPFPGPGLAIRILGEITWERLETLRQADAIFIQTLRETEWYYKVAQAFAVLLPSARSTGVAGDQAKFGQTIVLRAVVTNDFMTASPAQLPYELLTKTSTRILNEVPDITRVTYDLSTKPPATIEWL
ncbi:MAG: glutamine-hydrolyzing GMP synthase [Ardenticatenaceae bacterium]